MTNTNLSDELWIAAGKKVKEREYWLDKLTGELTKSSFPLIYAKEPAKADARGISPALNVSPGKFEFSFSEALSTRLIEISNSSEVRLHIVLTAVLVLLLGQYTGNDDIIIGSPILKSGSSKKKADTAELINTAVVLRVRLADRMTFKELLLVTRQTIIEADEHRNYPIDILSQQLNVPGALFDVALMLENIHDIQYLDQEQAIIFAFSRTGDTVEGRVEYDTSTYGQKTIAKIAGHYCRAVEHVLTDVNILVSEVDVLSPDEKKQLLFAFNNTAAEYPEDNTIIDLFEEQARKKPGNIALVGTTLCDMQEQEPPGEAILLTYRQFDGMAERLAGQLRKKGIVPGTIVGIMVERSIEMVAGIYGILKAGAAYLPIDPAYPRERIDYILSDSGAELLLTKHELASGGPLFEKSGAKTFPKGPTGHLGASRRIKSFVGSRGGFSKEPLVTETVPGDMAYIIYTSGSTGKPKGVMVRHTSVVNIITALQRCYPLGEQDTYLFKTSYIFDVSVAELFGWFPAGGRLAVLKKGGEKEPVKIIAAIERHAVSHINFVPSMFNVFVEELNPGNIGKLAGLKYIFLAGEALLPELVNKFRQFDTPIKLENIYGPTEGTVYTTNYSLPDRVDNGGIPIGKPMQNIRAYILSKENRLLPIGVPGELCISGSGLAMGYLNNPELTAEKFIASGGPPTRVGQRLAASRHIPENQLPVPLEGARAACYKTGDLARWLPDGNIEFLGRIDHQVKIRGFRIELGEIENRLIEYEWIKETVVTAREDRAGEKYICAYIVVSGPAQIDETELRDYLSRRLPAYMIPSSFVQLKKIPMTLNGKIDRKMLPEPQLRGKGNYTAPGDEIEKKLAEIWSEVLFGRDRLRDLPEGQPAVGIDDNFFELGGHSLKGSVLVSKIHQAFDTELALEEVFNRPTIRKLAALLNRAGKSKYSAVEIVEEQEYYPLSSGQKRLYLLHRMEPGSRGYNTPVIMMLTGKVEANKLAETFRELIKRHEGLRTSFEMINEEPVQRIHNAAGIDFEIEYIEAGNRHAESSKQIDFFIRPFDLSLAPLLQVGLIKQDEEKHILMVDMHHIISDGVSHGILVNDFMALYESKEERLFPLTVRYRDYARWQQGRLEKGSLKKQEAYWLEEFAGEIPVLQLPMDFLRPAVQNLAGNILRFEIGEQETEQLRILALQEESTLFMVLFTLFNILLSRLSGQEEIVVGSPAAGRTAAELDRVIGYFVNTLAIRSNPAGDKTFSAFLHEVKAKTLSAFESQEYQFEELVEKLSITRDIGRNPLFDVMFALQNLDIRELEIPGLKLSPYPYHSGISKFDMIFICEEARAQTTVTVEYAVKLFKKETITRFFNYYKKLLSNVLADRHILIGEIDILSEAEQEEMLAALNGEADFPGVEIGIHRLFEEQVEKNPDAVALTGPSTPVHVMDTGQRRLDTPPEGLDKSFDQTFSKVWPPAGAHHVGGGLGPEARMSLSYKELNRHANRLARALRKKGVMPGSIVGIMMDRSIEMAIATLAVLKAGGAYLPLDPSYPGERIRFMLDDSGARTLLTKSGAIEGHSFTGLLGLDTPAADGSHRTAPRGQITALDALHPLDRSGVDYEKYRGHIGQAMVKNALSLQATRGCPYDCAYCHKIWPRNHVFRSAGNIFAELRHYYDLGVRRFVFIDDIFNINAANSSEFFRLIIDHKLDIRLFFPNGMRGDILTKEYIDLMVAAGTVNVALALETASPRLQKKIGKNLNLKKFRENLEYFCTRYPHVILELFTMHGFPSETEAEARQTLDFIKNLKWIHFPYVHILKIYPATAMADIAMQHGISAKDIARSANLAFHQLPATLPFDKKFTLEYQADFLNRYFLNKERLLHVLPYQMEILSEDEIVQKYDSYLPVEIKSLQDLLDFAGPPFCKKVGPKTFPEGPSGHLERTTPTGIPKTFDEAQHRRGEPCVPPYMRPDTDVGAGLAPAHESRRVLKTFDTEDNLTPNAAKRLNATPRMWSLRILLLDLSQFFSRDKRSMLYDVVEPPLGLMYLSTALNREFGGNISVKIAKSRIDFDDYPQLKGLLDDFKPHVIGLRTLTYYKDFFHQTAALIRQWGVHVPIIAGGPYAASDSSSVLRDKHIDLVVLGEGELTLCHITGEILKNGGRLPGEAVLRQIPGIAFMPRESKLLNNVLRTILLVDFPAAEVEDEEMENVPAAHRAGDTAYVIYTSGTTGKPKGVLVEHRNVTGLMVTGKTLFDYDRRDVWTMFHSYCFDFSVWEMYGSLLFGGRLVLIPRMVARDPRLYLQILKKEQVTILNQTPTVFYRLIEEEIQSGSRDLHIGFVIFGGEALKPGKLKAWIEKYPHTKLINMYGITETTVHVTFKEITCMEIDANISNIGKPIASLCAYIMNKHRQLQPAGVPGELVVGGHGVARGYLNHPELTAERFASGGPPFCKKVGPKTFHEGQERRGEPCVPPPMHSEPGVGAGLAPARDLSVANGRPLPIHQRLYRSGDLVKLNGAAEMEYLGRIDHQVKIRGNRVETGEIERHLINRREVEEALVIAREDEKGDNYLCAYLKFTGDELSVPELREVLLLLVPDYMIPSYFITVDKFPVTATGKVDRLKLPLPGRLRSSLKAEYTAPQTGTAGKIAVLWQEVLKIDKVGIHDNFFDLGGTSLDIVRLTNRLKELLVKEIPVVTLFEYPTIHDFTCYLEQCGTETAPVLEEEMSRAGAGLKKGRDKMKSRRERLGR